MKKGSKRSKRESKVVNGRCLYRGRDCLNCGKAVWSATNYRTQKFCDHDCFSFYVAKNNPKNKRRKLKGIGWTKKQRKKVNGKYVYLGSRCKNCGKDIYSREPNKRKFCDDSCGALYQWKNTTRRKKASIFQRISRELQGRKRTKRRRKEVNGRYHYLGGSCLNCGKELWSSTHF